MIITVALAISGYVLVVLLAGVTGGLVYRPSAGRLGDVSAAAGVPLIAAAVPLTCALILARRSGATRLAAAGLVLLAVPAVVAVGRAVSIVPLTVRYESDNTVTPVLMSTMDIGGPLDVGATVSAGALLLGVALIVAAHLRPAGEPARRWRYCG